MNIIEQIKEEAKYFFEEADGCHDWDHTERVFNLCMHIGKIEGVDLEILGISALLHDIGRPEESRQRGKVCHAEIGSVLAEQILIRYALSLDKIEKIKHCIERHRFRKGLAPESKEAKILFDADKLDSLGAIGLGRAFVFAGAHGAKVHNHPSVDIENTESYTKEDTAYREFYHKLKKVKDRLFTEEGKRIAKERHKFMEDFFERIDKEIAGEV